MKIDADKVLLSGIICLLSFIAAVVWDGVQTAEQNQVKLELMREDQKEMKADMKDLRRELYAIYPVMSEMSEAADLGTGTIGE
jgi:hypothetical protein